MPKKTVALDGLLNTETRPADSGTPQGGDAPPKKRVTVALNGGTYRRLRLHAALLHDSTAARVGALFQLLVQDTTAQDFGLPSSAIRLRM